MTSLQTVESVNHLPMAAGETASSGAAAQAAAMVQARFVMAMQRPRDIDDVRVRLLKECKRPGFAAVAEYNKPIGKGVRGPSIRFVEAALRCLGNVDTDAVTVFDDDTKRLVTVYVTDLETNTTYKKSVTITKTVERRNVKGYEVLGSRVNSYGDTVYIVRATDDDILNKEGALVSKALRTLGLRIIPGDLVDEAMDLCRHTVAAKDKEDPDAARKRLADAFSAIGVGPADLAQYLGHSLGQTTPAELADLRQVYATLKDGEAKWSDYLDQGQGEPEQPKQTKSSRTAEALKSRKAKAKKVPSGPDVTQPEERQPEEPTVNGPDLPPFDEAENGKGQKELGW